MRHEVRSLGVSHSTIANLLTHVMIMVTGFSTLALRIASYDSVRERIPPAGSALGLRGHPAGHLEHRSGSRRGIDRAADQGGTLRINDSALIERTEIIRETGTNRSRFFSGVTDKYTWSDIGSSFLPSELVTAFLSAHFEQVGEYAKDGLLLFCRINRVSKAETP